MTSQADRAKETARRRIYRDECRRRLEADPDLPVQHGNAGTYNNWGCRCDECRAAAVAAVQNYRARKKIERAQRANRWERKR